MPLYRFYIVLSCEKFGFMILCIYLKCILSKTSMFVTIRYLAIFWLSLFSLRSAAQVKLTKVLVNGTTTKLVNGVIRMKASQDELALEFRGITGDSTTYFYRLKGLEEKWIPTAYPSARYQGLAGGSYIFQLKSSHGGKESAPLQIKVEKEKAFWNEWWFIPSMVAYVLVLIGVGIYLFFLYDFRQRLKMLGVRNQIAADLHDEVGSNLNSIAIFVEVLRKKAPIEMLPILEKIIENSRESVSLMQDTVWTINPKNDSVAKLFERMNSFASQVLSSKDIAFEFMVDANPAKINFSMEQRKNIYLIFKEAINNAVKHADATKVNIHISAVRDQMEMRIADNGRGFDTRQTHQGNGLFNFQERADEAGISLKIESELNVGTTISLKVMA